MPRPAAYRGNMPRLSLVLRVVLPAFWLGALIAISFIEAPLKFTRPSRS